jgi:phenylacetate-coenzyme A ligase PaaK-like adenylate-forming protein
METLARVWGRTLERVFLPAWERTVHGRSTFEHLAFLETTQWWTPEELEALQLAKLRALLVHAGQEVPYYRELFRRIGFSPRELRHRADLACIPPLTKEIIRERYDDLVAPAHRGRNLRKGTSGSTGTPLSFEYSPSSHAWREATKIRGYRWGGFELGHVTFHYWAQVHAPPKGMARVKLDLDRAIRRDVFADSMKQDEPSMLEAVRTLRSVAPRVIVAYTQSGAQLARFILDRGLRDWPNVPVICGAEAVLAADRAALERAFGPVFETYGSRETMLMAAECGAHDGLHLCEENVLVEVTRDGVPVADGRVGEVLVTDLHNWGMPFIRYANGDRAAMRVGQDACACGRGLRRLHHVDGRRADMLIGHDGSEIPGIVFHVLFSDARREVVKQFQVRQRPDRAVVLTCVPGKDWDEAAFAAIVARCREYLRGLTLSVQLVTWIRPAANGKRRTVIVEATRETESVPLAPAACAAPAR